MLHEHFPVGTRQTHDARRRGSGRRALLDHYGQPVGCHARCQGDRAAPAAFRSARDCASAGRRRPAHGRVPESVEPQAKERRGHIGLIGSDAIALTEAATQHGFRFRIEDRDAIPIGSRVGKVTLCERRQHVLADRLLIELDDQAVLAHTQGDEEVAYACRAARRLHRRLLRRMNRIGHRNQNRRHVGHDRARRVADDSGAVRPGAGDPFDAASKSRFHRCERGRPVCRFERAQARVELEQVEPARGGPREIDGAHDLGEAGGGLPLFVLRGVRLGRARVEWARSRLQPLVVVRDLAIEIGRELGHATIERGAQLLAIRFADLANPMILEGRERADEEEQRGRTDQANEEPAPPHENEPSMRMEGPALLNNLFARA